MGPRRPGARARGFARESLRTADHDLTLATDLCERGWHADAAMHAQQAVEKAIKGALELCGVATRSHEVDLAFTEHLVEAPEHASWHDRLAELRPLIDQFDGLWTDTRYPRWDPVRRRVSSPMDRYGPEQAAEAVERAGKVAAVLKEFVSDAYRVTL